MAAVSTERRAFSLHLKAPADMPESVRPAFRWLMLCICKGKPASVIYRAEQIYLKRRYEAMDLPQLAKLH